MDLKSEPSWYSHHPDRGTDQMLGVWVCRVISPEKLCINPKLLKGNLWIDTSGK